MWNDGWSRLAILSVFQDNFHLKNMKKVRGTIHRNRRLNHMVENTGGGSMKRMNRTVYWLVPVVIFVLSACTLLQPKPLVEKSNAAHDLSPQVSD